LRAESIKVGADVYLRDWFQSRGTVDFRNATIAENLDCSGGYFDNPGHVVLSVNSAKIGGSVLLSRHFEARGTLLFLSASIGGVLELGTSEPNEIAILENAILDLTDAKAEGLLNEKGSWPREGNLRVHGF